MRAPDCIQMSRERRYDTIEAIYKRVDGEEERGGQEGDRGMRELSFPEISC
jgi:hypothetical protein